MRRTLPRPHQLFLAICFATLPLAPVQGQTKPESRPQEQTGDVIRINTDLVQTDVMVFDKKGRFVDGLQAEQFALKVDNKPRPILFFDRVNSGSATSARIAEAVGGSRPSTNTSAMLNGRTVFFYIDDLHLAPDSMVRTRKALLEFLEHGMGANDQVAITSPSGQVGFLQQITNDKIALRAAIARLNYRGSVKSDMDNPPMSEYIAMKIRDGDEQAITYYVQELQKQNCYKSAGSVICSMSAQAMRLAVRQRAQQMVTMAAPDTDNTLNLLEGLMRSAGQLPGRKLVFMISDGFYLNDRQTSARDRIKRITDAAGRAGVVIYTLDARGIIGESLDVTNNRPIDGEGLTASSNIGESLASQDGLNALAGDTGGRAFRNTNAPMSEWVDKVLAETSNYYLLAWRPDSEEQKRGKFNHIEATITGRPDLTVRLRRGYFKTAPLPVLTTKKKPEKDPTKAREDDMRLVIDAPVSQRQIPTDLALSFTQMPGVGTRVTASVQISRDALAFELTDGKQAADVDIGGIFYDDKGKPVSSFVGRLRVFPVPAAVAPTKATEAVYAFYAWLPAGLYQVRVGVRDLRTGRIGSAMQWIQIPRL